MAAKCEKKKQISLLRSVEFQFLFKIHIVYCPSCYMFMQISFKSIDIKSSEDQQFKEPTGTGDSKS